MALFQQKPTPTMKRLLFIAAACVVVPFISATPTASTISACKQISASLPADHVIFPLTNPIQYAAQKLGYWSLAAQAVSPACVVVPSNAEHVATAVKILAEDFPAVEFAVRSGGHDPNVGDATTEGGVLISMSELKGTTYDSATGLATVKPGGEWNDVISALEEYGVTVPGGRLGIVGVAGLLLQGGVSFLTPQYGFAGDSIISWETVLANGSIVNIDSTKQPDLAKAMRGSGNQFGIVTEFQIQTYPIGPKVWGGIRVYTSSHDDEIFALLHEFVPHLATDPKGTVLHTGIVAVGGVEASFIWYFYDGPEPPTEGPYAKLLDIPSLIDTTSSQSYSSLLEANGDFGGLLIARDSFTSFTIPYVPAYPSMYAEIKAKYVELTTPFLSNPLHATSQFSVNFQPLPNTVGAASVSQGGNAIGLTGSDPHVIIVTLQTTWLSSSDDETQVEIAKSMTGWVDEQVPRWIARSSRNNGTAGGEGGNEYYLPIFMNEAMSFQNVTGSYRDYAVLKGLQEEMDPEGFWSGRTGGFKY